MTPTPENRFSADITTDEKGFIHVKESAPFQGEIILHFSQVPGLIDDLRLIAESERIKHGAR